MTVTKLHPDTEQHPLRDPALEAAFARHGVDTWSFDPALEVASVDKERSLANQARLEPLNIEIVERYAEDMAAGDTFPPVVVERQRMARQVRLVAIGGNHRLAAARIAKRATLAAYVVEGDAPALYRLMWEDNRRHGFPPGDKERLMAAAHLVDSGDSMAEAARTVGVAYGVLVMHIYAKEAGDRATRLGVVGWQAIKVGVRAHLRSVADDDLFTEVATLLIRYDVAQVAANELIVRMNKSATPTQARKAMEEAEKRFDSLQADPKARGRITDHQRMSNLLTDMRYLDVKKIIGECRSDADRAALAEKIKSAATVLQQIVRAVS